MDLFTQEGTSILTQAKSILGDWANQFDNIELSDLKATLLHIVELEKTTTIYPERSDIFRIYKEVPPDSVKVVVLGQDPYHDGNANGRAFGCKIKLSPSLQQIEQAILKDVGGQPITDHSLQYLSAQGVLLLNTVLTVQKGTPLTHERIGWQRFTLATVKAINKFNRPVVWMLWGGRAKAYHRFIHHPRHLVLQADHPQAANYSNTLWKCTHFSKANQYLKQNRQTEIKWT